MFIGRERELKTLNTLWQKQCFQMVVLYGRRRIGKTTLLREFLQGKPGILFSAQEANDAMNLEEMSRKIYRFFELPEATGRFRSWNDVFTFLAEKAQEKQLILAFDEFPYAAEANAALKSILQNSIDHQLKETGLFLILCGSHIAFMENEVLGYKSPLFGRRTAQIQLHAFDYLDAARMLEGFSHEDMIRFYCCLGGTPHYLAQIDRNETFSDNMKRLYFDISGYLYNEPMMLLQQELREPAMYNAITGAIAGGASRLNEISLKLNEDAAKIAKYLRTLMALRIVEREFPFGEDRETSRKGIYRLADACYGFWYRFVFPNRPEIESGNGDLIADGGLFDEPLSTYMGKPWFEDICRQYLIRRNRRRQLPFIATLFGSWWGNDPKQRAQSDFDIIAADRAGKRILLGECKWRNSLDDVAEIRKLMDKTHLLPEYEERYWIFFSKVPFTPAALRLADEHPNLTLVTLDQLFEEDSGEGDSM